jgi:hypothetical protein
MEQMSPEQLQALFAAYGAVIIIVAVIGTIVGLAIAIFINYLLYDAFRRVPQPFRLMEPGMVWLLLIPCFNIIWNFWVFPKLSDSMKAYFDSVNRTDVGDCGRQLGMFYCFMTIAPLVLCLPSCIPMIGMLFSCLSSLCSLGSLVLLILYLVKVTGLKKQIPAA